MSSTCPACHDHATTLQLRSNSLLAVALYCPNCGWREDEIPPLKGSDDLCCSECGRKCTNEESTILSHGCVCNTCQTYPTLKGSDTQQTIDDMKSVEEKAKSAIETCYDCGKRICYLDTNQSTSPENIGNFSSIDGQIRCPACFSAFLQQLLKSETVYQAPNHPPQVEVVPGALSTPGIAYQLIPPIVWERGAKRFMLGEERKSDKAWNADSPNQHILTNKKFILDRLAHVMAHTLKLMDKIRHNKDLTDDDDAAAIWWGGSFAICATEALTKEKEKA